MTVIIFPLIFHQTGHNVDPLLIVLLICLAIAFVSAVIAFMRSEIDGIPVTTGIVALFAFAFVFGLGIAYLIVLIIENV